MTDRPDKIMISDGLSFSNHHFPQMPNIEINGSEKTYQSLPSSRSFSVERLVEVTRRLTMCNQVLTVFSNQNRETHSPTTSNELQVLDKFPSTPEIATESNTNSTDGDLTVTNCSYPFDDTNNQGGSPSNTTARKWVRLLGISPEDIGDEDAFIKAAKDIAKRPSSISMTPSEQVTLTQSWNAALDSVSIDHLTNSMSSIFWDSCAKDKSPFVPKRYTQVKKLQQDELLRLIAAGKPSYEQVHMWRTSFEALLADKYGLALFREFLATEFSDENIEFWIACEHYKTISQPKKQEIRAQKIYEDFVATQACREVNLDSATRDQTVLELVNPSPHTFENAQKRIQALMERDSYRRFLRSDLYTTLMQQAKQAARELAAAARESSSSNSMQSDGTKFKLPPFKPFGSSGTKGIGTDLPGVLAAAADAEAGMNSVQDLQLLGLSTSRHMQIRINSAAKSKPAVTSTSKVSPTTPSLNPTKGFPNT